MAELYPPLGMPRPLHCDVCGARVKHDECNRHQSTGTEYIRLIDKYAQLRFSRKVYP